MTILITSLAFGLSFGGTCMDRAALANDGPTTATMMDELRPHANQTGLICDGATQYNDMASLFLTDPSTAIQVHLCMSASIY